MKLTKTAEFAANSRTDIPYLLERVGRLEKRIQQAKNLYRECGDLYSLLCTWVDEDEPPNDNTQEPGR